MAKDQAGCRAAYEAAAAKVLVVEYPRHARALAELLGLIAQTDALAEAANVDLPAGADRLSPVEACVCRAPDVPGYVVSDEVFIA